MTREFREPVVSEICPNASLSRDLTSTVSWARRRITKLRTRSQGILPRHLSTSSFSYFFFLHCVSTLVMLSSSPMSHKHQRPSPKDGGNSGKQLSVKVFIRALNTYTSSLDTVPIEHTPQLRYERVLAVHHLPPMLSNRLIMLHVGHINPYLKSQDEQLSSA